MASTSIAQPKKKKKPLILLRDGVLFLLIIPALFVFSFGSALLQEKDTFAVVVAAAQLHVNGSDMQDVGRSKMRWILRRGLDGVPLDKHFAARGWARTKQQSAVRFYKRDGHVIYVRFTPYTSRYVIAQADREP